MWRRCDWLHISLMDPQHHGGRKNFTATFPVDTVTWDQFQQAFRTAHVSAGAMAMKKREFCNLRQGGHTVGQYVDDFRKLALYAQMTLLRMQLSKRSFWKD